MNHSVSYIMLYLAICRLRRLESQKNCVYIYDIFKAVLINIFMFSLDQMITCNARGLIHSDAPTKSWHLILLFPSALWNVVLVSTLLFWVSSQL